MFRNPLNPMEEILALQTYGEDPEVAFAPTEIITNGCVVTNTCPPPKPVELEPATIRTIIGPLPEK